MQRGAHDVAAARPEKQNASPKACVQDAATGKLLGDDDLAFHPWMQSADVTVGAFIIKLNGGALALEHHR